MATNKKISELPTNPNITGQEQIAEERGGSNYKNTIDEIKSYVLDGFSGSVSSVNTRTGDVVLIGSDMVLDNGQGTTSNGNTVDLGGGFSGQIEIKSENQGDSLKIISESNIVAGVSIDSSLTVSNTQAKLEHSFPLGGQSSSVGVNGSIAEITSFNTADNKSALVSANEDVVIISVINNGITESIKVNGGQGVSISAESGLGINYKDQSLDESNVPTWGSSESENHIPSEARIIANLPSGDVTSVNSQTGDVLLTGSDIETSISSGTTIDSAILALQTDKANQSYVDSLGLQVSDNRVDLDSHILDTSNPHDVTPLQLGLQNVDNTSDVNKPISNDTQSALNTKIGANNYATFDTGGTVKMSRDSATSTTYISFDGSDTPNVT